MATNSKTPTKRSKLALLVGSPGEFLGLTRRWLQHRTRRLWARKNPASEARTSHVWAIGLYRGPTPLDLAPAPDCPNPIFTRRQVTDISAAFVADPFVIRRGPNWYLFFEVLNHRYPPGRTDMPNPRGEIGVAISRDLRTWQYQGIVLAESNHLSYPHVFEWEGDYYMVPETLRSRSVALYRAVEFPLRWEKVGLLLEGDRFADTTLFRRDGRWWLFTESGPNNRNDLLRLFSADELRGPWREHPASPVVRDNPHFARPAGPVVEHEGRLLRFSQDCEPLYGLQVYAFEILELTPTSYRERLARPEPILRGSGRGWNATGMHQLDAHRAEDGTWWAVVDGWFAATAAEWGGRD